MSDVRRAAALDTECATLVTYLTGGALASEVSAAYRRAHALGGVAHSAVSPALDHALLALAHAGPGAARIADSYAVLFARSSTLRRKIVLLVAILESRGESSRALDVPDATNPARWLARMCGQAAGFAVRLLASIVLVTPLQLWFLMRGVPPPTLTARFPQ